MAATSVLLTGADASMHPCRGGSFHRHEPSWAVSCTQAQVRTDRCCPSWLEQHGGLVWKEMVEKWAQIQTQVTALVYLNTIHKSPVNSKLG